MNGAEYALKTITWIPVLWFGCWIQKSVLLKSYQKLFPSVSYELLKVPWCFICQTKSPYVEIKWLKGYCIQLTFMENIPDQSWGRNRWTPCRNRRASCLLTFKVMSNSTWVASQGHVLLSWRDETYCKRGILHCVWI